ncbi:MAG: NAD(P)H-binding protein, partial [Desulfobacter sp.]|nr:NAD(P)H-binding protein [Desulfobacter sp.]
MNNTKPILVTGATGYVSGRLIPLLLANGYKIKAMGRSITKMMDRPWGKDKNVKLVKGDIQDIQSLKNAAKGCGTVYYLVHSMISQKGKYRDADKTGAKNMVQAAAEEGLEHIIYLGGL